MNDQITPASKPEETTGPAGQPHTAALGTPIATAQQYSGLAARRAPNLEDAAKGIGGPYLKTPEMPHQIPSLGRIVNYVITADQAREINNRRAHADAHRSSHKAAANGTMVHTGASVTEGRKFPMIITAVHGDEPTSLINGQVFLDGNDSLWVTSVELGTAPGTYSWPQRT